VKTLLPVKCIRCTRRCCLCWRRIIRVRGRRMRSLYRRILRMLIGRCSSSLIWVLLGRSWRCMRKVTRIGLNRRESLRRKWKKIRIWDVRVHRHRTRSSSKTAISLLSVVHRKEKPKKRATQLTLTILSWNWWRILGRKPMIRCIRF